MKKTVLTIAAISAVFLLNTCALEIANVIGPDGGYVFYDKGSYTFGWRYIQCSPYDFGELKDAGPESVEKALKLCNENTAEWHKFGWEIPTEAHMKKMLECFSYGLTKFSDKYYYLAVNDLYDVGRWWICDKGVKNAGKFCSECGKPAPADENWVVERDEPPNPDILKDSSDWEPVVLYKNFGDKANGAVEKVKEKEDGSYPFAVRVRAIRRF